MARFIPTTELDRAIRAMARHEASARPDLYRALAAGTDGELFFLVPYHQEIEGAKIAIKSGGTLPFIMCMAEGQHVVMLFSSEARADDFVKRNFQRRTYSVAAMPAKQMLEILGKADASAIVNHGCSTGGLIIGADLMRALASGEALEPGPMGNPEGPRRLRFQVVNPADYPTNLVQALFEVFRKHANFKAAWIFTRKEDQPAPDGRKKFYIMVLMNPRDPVLHHDMSIVAVAGAEAAGCEVETSLTDENNFEETALLFRKSHPFYVAPDYRPDTTPDAPPQT